MKTPISFLFRLVMKKESMFTMHGVMKTLTFTVGVFGFLTSMLLYVFLFNKHYLKTDACYVFLTHIQVVVHDFCNPLKMILKKCCYKNAVIIVI